MRNLLERLERNRYPQMTETVDGSTVGDQTKYYRSISLPSEITDVLFYSTAVTHPALRMFLGRAVDQPPPEADTRELITTIENMPGVLGIRIEAEKLTIYHPDADAFMEFEPHKAEAYYAIGSTVLAHDDRVYTLGVTTPDGYRISH